MSGLTVTGASDAGIRVEARGNFSGFFGSAVDLNSTAKVTIVASTIANNVGTDDEATAIRLTGASPATSARSKRPEREQRSAAPSRS